MAANTTSTGSDNMVNSPPNLNNEPIPTDCDNDSVSVCSGSSARSEERRRRRERWRAEHEDQIKVDGTFPRRNKDPTLGGEKLSKNSVSARVIQHLGTKSTASPHTLPPAVSDSDRVRSNLLRTLGIQQEPTSMLGMPDDGKGGLMGGIASGLGKGKGGHRRIHNADGKVILIAGNLGVKGGAPGGSAGFDPPVPMTPQPPPDRSLLSVIRLKEELKYDSDDDVVPYEKYSRSKRQQTRNADIKAAAAPLGKQSITSMNFAPNRRLFFSSDVVVVPIPMRSEYSNRIKERMYSNRVELSENAQRNVVEFEAEGWDASTVLDDENQFYKCPLTGELIHPVHLAYFNKGGSEAKE